MPAWPYLWRMIDTLAPALSGALVINVLLFTLGCLAVFLVLRAPLGDSVATLAVVLLIAFPAPSSPSDPVRRVCSSWPRLCLVGGPEPPLVVGRPSRDRRRPQPTAGTS